AEDGIRDRNVTVVQTCALPILIIIALTGLNPVTYIKKASEALLFAFTSRSSAGSLPLNIQTQTARLGVPSSIANFAGSFGLSIEIGRASCREGVTVGRDSLGSS